MRPFTSVDMDLFERTWRFPTLGEGAFILSTTEMVVSLSQQLEKCGLDLELGTFTRHISPLIKRLVCFI